MQNELIQVIINSAVLSLSSIYNHFPNEQHKELLRHSVDQLSLLADLLHAEERNGVSE